VRRLVFEKGGERGGSATVAEDRRDRTAHRSIALDDRGTDPGNGGREVDERIETRRETFPTFSRSERRDKSGGNFNDD